MPPRRRGRSASTAGPDEEPAATASEFPPAKKAAVADSSLAETKALVCELCASFYKLGWVSGTGGGLSIRVGDRIVMAPSGVQKERMQPDDLFLLDAASGDVLEAPLAKPPPARPPKLSECAPLFMTVKRREREFGVRREREGRQRLGWSGWRKTALTLSSLP